MLVTQKCQYGLRAIFALARRGAQRPVKIASIAEEQAIPIRFLEAILNQLKQAGFVDSRRGVDGGYWLARRPECITVGEIARAIDGPIHAEGEDQPGRRGQKRDVFEEIWRRASNEVYVVLDGITLADLMERQLALDSGFVANYTI